MLPFLCKFLGTEVADRTIDPESFDLIVGAVLKDLEFIEFNAAN